MSTSSPQPENFLTSLFASIFTPGPTPSLLLATNASFALLQLLLLALLLATYSVHFLILSFLSAGLWYAINWFARELLAANEKEDEARRLRGVGSGSQGGKGAGGEGKEVSGGSAGEGTDTETEVEGQGEGEGEKGKRRRREMVGAVRREERRNVGTAGAGAAASATNHGLVGATTGSGYLNVGQGEDALRRRGSGVGGETSGAEMSTDSEWEKVDEDR